jgi:hypothetical protein
VDSLGSAYVTGTTNSNESSFPVTVGPDLTYNGSSDYWGDAFIAKVNEQGTHLDYCGYIGGINDDHGRGVAVDSQGNAYVVGTTTSDESYLPVCVGPDLTINGLSDGFIAKVKADGTGLTYCGYIGGANGDASSGVAVDDDGCAFICGSTGSDEASFPVKIGPELIYGGGGDLYVAKLKADGSDFVYCGYIGGTGHDYEGRYSSIALDPSGCVYVGGVTASDETSLPVIAGPDLTYNGGTYDNFLAKLPPFHVLLRAGNVNTIWEDPVDVLYVNGSAGKDAYRTIVNPAGTPVTIGMAAPPGGPNPAAFALYAWPGEAGETDIAEQPFDIGTACFPMPLSNGVPAPPPYTIVNNIGYPSALGIPKLPGIQPAPTFIIKNKILSPGTWTLQGIIYDNNAPVFTVSLTNAIVLKQQ